MGVEDQLTDEAPPSNRQLGLAWTAYVLNRLYEAWPERVSLSPFEVSAEAGTPNLAMDREMAVWDGLRAWLVDEGLVRAATATIGDGSLRHATLTGKGFAVLQVPSPGAPEKTVGSRLGELAKEAGRQTGKEAVREGAKHAGQEIAGILGSFVGQVTKAWAPF